MSTAIKFKPMRHAQTYLLVMAVFLVYWGCMLAADPARGQPLAAAGAVMVLPALCAMFWAARAQGAHLARALGMLGKV